jgi:hypothetical protein
VPDKNVDIVWETTIYQTRDTSPLLVFVNSRGSTNKGICRSLSIILSCRWIWRAVDRRHIELAFTILILVCGGDGNGSWTISTLERWNLKRSISSSLGNR